MVVFRSVGTLSANGPKHLLPKNPPRCSLKTSYLHTPPPPSPPPHCVKHLHVIGRQPFRMELVFNSFPQQCVVPHFGLRGLRVQQSATCFEAAASAVCAFCTTADDCHLNASCALPVSCRRWVPGGWSEAALAMMRRCFNLPWLHLTTVQCRSVLHSC